MRKVPLISMSLAIVLLGAGVFALAAAGGDSSRRADVQVANARTAHAASVHYNVAVTLTKARVPMTLQIRGGSAIDRLSVHLRLGLQTATIMRDQQFLYETAPQGLAMISNFAWLRLSVGQRPARSEVLSTLRSLTPAPLLHIVAEAKLRAVRGASVFAGPVAYDDPVVRTALHDLSAGLEFRNLRVRVVVG